MPVRSLLLAALLLLVAPASRGPSATAKPPRFEHVVVVVFENKEADEVVGRSDAPTFLRLARQDASLARYYGIAHPSLPNYLALVSGSTHGITANCTDCVIDARNIADSLEAAKLTWKTYAEGLPRVGYPGVASGRYVKRHDPLVYFRDVDTRPERMKRIVPLAQLSRDLARGKLPSFSLVVPDLCHDMHDCPVAVGDAWLAKLLPPLLGSKQLQKDSAVFVVFDEGSSALGGGGHVPALVLGPLVRPGARSTARVDHYGLLRTIEDGFGLPRLGLSARARPIRGIWR